MNSPQRDNQHNNFDNNTQSLIQDNSSLHRYRTEIPNIIYELKLDVYELALYNILKHVAGDYGSCFQSNNTLAEKVCCGVTKLIEAKSSLEKRGLIKVTKRKKPDGGDTTDLIEIVDIWAFNMRKMLEKFGNKGGSPNGEGGGRHVKGGGPPNGDKQEPIKQEPIEQQQQAAVFGCLKDIEIPESDKVWITKRFTEAAVQKAVAWATHPLTKIEKTLQQAIKWACTQPNLELPKAKEPPLTNKEKVEKRFVHYQTYNGAICFIDNEGIGFQRGQTHYQVSYKEKGFDFQLDNILKKMEIYV